ncbi:MAG TPA: LptA/OstA family protein [Stellaceae bacterium]|nr:LptA/OstA family protein [Stellaceae bacterium]
MTRTGSLRWLALGLALMLPLGARAQNFGLGLSGQSSDKPIDIRADNGIEWQQTNRVYIARGNARATRGQATVYGDTLLAFYRPLCSPEAIAALAVRAAWAATAAVRPPPPNQAANAPPPKPEPPRVCPDAAATAPGQNAAAKPASDPSDGGSTEIFRLEAQGNVRIVTDTQTVYGDHAIYDVDRATLVVTGAHLKLETQRDTVTARDSLEWYDDKQLAVARGDALEIREGKRLAGDVLMGEVEKDANGSSHIARIDARGNVLVSSADQIARGDAGVYNLDTGIATLTGRVSITRGENEMTGRYGVVDLNKNISRLLAGPPNKSIDKLGDLFSEKPAEGGTRERVHGELKRAPSSTPSEPGAKPNDKPRAKPSDQPATKTPDQSAATPSAQPLAKATTE